MKYLLTLVMMVWATAVIAEYETDPNVTEGIDITQCSEFFPFPLSHHHNDELLTLCRLNYAVVYDTECRIPLMTFQNMRPEDLDGDEPRRNNFKRDPNLIDNHASELSDYYRSGFDRGHMVPAGDMREDAAAMSQSFYMSNITPQYPATNRGEWRSVENEARALVNRFPYTDTYVITGVIMSDEPQRIGQGVCVPSMLIKIVINNQMYRAYGVTNSPNPEVFLLHRQHPTMSSVMEMLGFEIWRE